MAEATQRERSAWRVSLAMASMALAVAILNLSGWAIGLTPLVRVRLDWPVVAPWTALWVMGLSLSVLAQGGTGIRKHSPQLVSLGRGLAVVVGLSSAVVLVEYALDTTWIDLWWFPEAVRFAQDVRPGRPALPTTVTMGALAVLCLLIRVEARWVRRVWIGSQVVLLPWPLLALSGYLFRALHVLSTSLSNGMAFTTTLAAVFVAAAAMASRVDRPILAWFLDRPDRVTVARLTLVLAGLPAGVWVVRAAASTYLSGERDPWVVALVFGTVATGVGVYVVSGRQQRDLFAQLALRDQVVEANDQLRQVMDHSPIGLCTVGADGRLLTANPAFCRLLGRDEETLRRLTWREVSHPDDAGRAEALLDDLLSGQVGSFDVRHRYLRPDGELVCADVSATALHADDGSVRMVISQVVDVTAQVGAQAALEESEARYRRMTEYATDAVATLAPDGTIEWVSDSVTGLLGYAAAGLRGQAITSLLHPDDAPTLDEARARASGSQQSRFETRLITASGDARWVSVLLRPVVDDAGTQTGWITGWRDITAERTARDALAEREERSREMARQAESEKALLRVSADALLDPQVLLEPQRDARGRIVDFRYADVNRAACIALSESRDELVGSSLLGRAGTMAGAALMERYADIVTSGEPLELDGYGYARDPDAPERLFDLRAVRVPDGRVNVTWRDVTVQRQSALHLAESEERYRLLAENTADVVALSKEGVFQWVSPSVTNGFGWTPEELVGRPVAGYIHPDDRGWVLSRRDGVERGEAARLRYRFLAKDQSYRWVEVAAAPFLGPDGRPEGVVANVRVVDAAVEAEEQLRHARAAAEVAAEAKATFLANMSHEIRTPLSAVLGLLRLLRDSDQNEVQHDYTVRAEQSAQSLLDILNDILDFSKIEAGALALHQRPFSVDAMVRNLGTVLAANLGDKPVDLLFDPDPKCPDRVMGDELRLRQVLLNLCGNALKFTPAGHVLVSTRVASRTSDRVTVRVSVEDTGIGMAPEAVAQVTDSFAQADPGIARSYGGTGLGLAISTRLLGLMGSELDVTSAPGAGSTFAFTVSLGVVESAPSGPEPAELPALQAHVVGGSPALQEVTGRICRSFGWELDAGTTGDPWDESASPEVILVDVPGATAEDMDVIGRLRAAYPRPLTPDAGSAPGTVIIALVTQAGLAGVSPADASRLDGYVVKPFTPSSLLDAVVAARARQPAAPSERAARAPRLTGIRVLLVEDNEINRQVAEAMLRNEQASVSVATDGRAAVDRVLGDPGAFDIVLMDQQMPVMDGLAAARAIRAEPAADRLPVLAMTANATEADRQACLEAGMSDHLGKPFDLDDLVDRILRLTTHAPGAPQPTGASANGGALVLDTVSGLRRVGDRKDFYTHMLATFAGGLSARVAGIEHAVAAGDRVAAGRLAHALSGAAATLGAMRLAAAAADVEASAAHGGLPVGAVDTSTLARCAEETQAAMSAWVSSHGLKAPDDAAPEPLGRATAT